MTQPEYIGRFAPSPSGPLHIGSLIAALASFLEARSNDGYWYVRIEDLDPPRESPEAAAAILAALEKLHLHWDGELLYQSHREAAYRQALEKLQDLDLIFPCICSRRDIRKAGGIYPGTCRHKSLDAAGRNGRSAAIRCRVPDESIRFIDRLQGEITQNLATEAGDFIIKRRDGLFAYQLAVVVDDAAQRITHIVRGTDLLESTARQIWLQRKLDYRESVYSHIPILVNRQGRKLSKQHGARPLELDKPGKVLYDALRYLQQSPDSALAGSQPPEILEWAIANWRPEKLRSLYKLDSF